jgi:hypothetical protein
LNQRFSRPHLDRLARAGGALLNTAVNGFDLMRFLTGAGRVPGRADRAAVTGITEDEVVALVRLGRPIRRSTTRTTAGAADASNHARGDRAPRALPRAGAGQESLGPVPAVPRWPWHWLPSWMPCSTGTHALHGRDGLQAVRMVEPPPVRGGRRRGLPLSEVRTASGGRATR